MADMVRFTAWISTEERRGIKETASLNQTSDNYIVRTALRRFLGLTTHTGIVAKVTKETETEN